MLNGAQDAARQIAAELGGCRDCIARLAAIYLGNYASALAQWLAKVARRKLRNGSNGASWRTSDEVALHCRQGSRPR